MPSKHLRRPRIEHQLGTGLGFKADLVEVGAAAWARAALGAGLRFVRGQAVGRHLFLVVDAAGDDGLVRVAFEEVDDHFLADARVGDMGLRPYPICASQRCWRQAGAAVLNSGVPGCSRHRYWAAAMRWR